MKPDLTYGVIQDAMNEARRLKATYPKGLTTQDLCKELGLENPRSARSVMNRPGFTQWDNLYKVTDVAAVLAYRHYYVNKHVNKKGGHNGNLQDPLRGGQGA